MIKKLDEFPLLAADPSRPIAILADIHSNIEALTSVEEWLERSGISDVVVLGDVIGYGASPQQTIDFVRERDWSVIRGNHEDMLLDPEFVDRTRSLKSSARKALEWTRRNLDWEALEYLDGLSPIARVGCDSIMLHGSLVDPRHCYAYIYEFSVDLNANRLREMNTPTGTIVWFGHTHLPAIFEVTEAECSQREIETSLMVPADRRYLINPGSVGFPRDGDPRSAFMVYDAASRRVEPVRLKYDVSGAAKRIRDSGYDGELADRLLAAR